MKNLFIKKEIIFSLIQWSKQIQEAGKKVRPIGLKFFCGHSAVSGEYDRL